MSDTALCYSGVTIRYAPDGAPAVENVSLSLAPGERVALLGLNGSGKTTLLHAAAGLLPFQGTIHLGGVQLGRRTLQQVRAGLGVVFNVPEDQLLFPRVNDDVAFGLIRRGETPQQAATRAGEQLAALEASHLADKTVHQLSHGEKQRVALAGALVATPSLLLLDEPSSGLDPPGRRMLARLLAGVEAALLVATHDLEFAARFCQRFVLLDHGRIVLEGGDLGEVARRWDLSETT